MSLVEETDEPNSTVLAAVERALDMLGESGKKAVLWHLSNAGMPKEEIPNRPNRFMGLLAEIFGSGAKVIETEIVRNIHQRAPLPPSARTFPGAVNELRDRGQTNLEVNCWAPPRPVCTP